MNLWIPFVPYSDLIVGPALSGKGSFGGSNRNCWCMYFFVGAIFWFAIAFALSSLLVLMPLFMSSMKWSLTRGITVAQCDGGVVKKHLPAFLVSTPPFPIPRPSAQDIACLKVREHFFLVKGHTCLKKRYCWWRAEFLLATLNVDTVYTWMENTDHWLQHFQPPKVRLEQTPKLCLVWSRNYEIRIPKTKSRIES